MNSTAATDFTKKIAPVILAGGFGTRLKPALGALPKALAPINGKPFIHYLFEQILTAGFKKVLICVGYQAEHLKDELKNKYKNLSIQYSHETSPLGTGGALRNAIPNINKDFFLVMNGDSYALINLSSLCRWFIEKELRAAIILGKINDPARFGSVQLAPNYLVESFQEKYSGVNSGFVNAGIYLFAKRLIEKIPVNCNFSLEKQFFPELANKDLYAYPHLVDFYDIGTPESYNKAGLFFLDLDKFNTV